MKIKDRKLGVMVDVLEKQCLNRSCYWARSDPGIFTKGQGYRKIESFDRGFLCGTREIKGCPEHI